MCVCVCVCVAKPVAVELRCHATALITTYKNPSCIAQNMAKCDKRHVLLVTNDILSGLHTRGRN